MNAQFYMKNLITNTRLITIVATSYAIFFLVLSIVISDVEWFQASGAVVTIGGVVLAARKIIRLGLEKFILDEQTIDGGQYKPTKEEIEHQEQFEKDINSYRWSIVLLIAGTLIWAYGGIVLKLLGVKA